MELSWCGHAMELCDKHGAVLQGLEQRREVEPGKKKGWRESGFVFVSSYPPLV